MLTLQTTFTYDDGHSTPPVDKATIVVSHPTYSLPRTSESVGVAPALIATGHASSQLRQRLLDKHYTLSIPTASVFGSQYAATLAGYLGPILRSGRLDLADVTLKFEVNYGTDNTSGQLDTIETLYFFKLLKPAKPETVTSGTVGRSAAAPSTDPDKVAVDGPHIAEVGSPNRVISTAPILSGPISSGPILTSPLPTGSVSPGPASSGPTSSGQVSSGSGPVTPGSTSSAIIIPSRRIPDILLQHPDWLMVDDRNTAINANLYLLSKTVYKSFLTQLFPNLSPDKEAVLLYIVNALVDLSGSSPALADDSEAYQRGLIAEILTFYGLQVTNTVYDFLSQNFMKLFDMPLHMPKFKLLTLAGKLRFRNPPASIPFDDFVFYHMSSEYSVMFGDRRDEFHSARYEWDKSGYQNNAITFSYTENAVLTSVRGRVVIRVKAFDQSELYRAEFDPQDPMLQQLDIVIDIRMPPALGTVSSVDGSSGQKLRGKIVPVSTTCTLKGSVVIQAKKSTADIYWQTVSAGMSDKAGNFSLPYPAGQYAAAQAITSLDPKHPTSIPVDIHSTTASISSDFLFILLQLDDSQAGNASSDSSAVQKSPDCNCSPQNLAGRLPSQDDLINSDQFTQDVGGGCLNLTVPNRTLREYSYTALVRSSDPDVASYTLQSALNEQHVDVYQLAPNGKVKRGTVDLDNPIRWQDGDDMASTELTVYQSVTVATGVILYYKSEFRADGYSLGDLIYSLPLAPGQKKQIVVVDASSSMVGTERQSVSQHDSLANSLLSERNIIDNIAGNIGETLQGQSNASTTGISAGLGAAGSAGFLGASLGVSGGYSNSNSSASQDSKRGLSEHFSEVLRQGLVQNASDYRQMNASAVTTVNEGQKYNAETEVIANHNHCHSMTMMYFEVLRHFAIFQDLVDVEECVFVPLLMARFTKENVMKWADMLCTRMLRIPSNTYVRPASFGGQQIHSLVPAFDSLERWRTNWELVDFPKGAYDEEIIQELQGDLLFKVDIPRPRTRYDFIMSYPIMATAVSRQVTDVQSLKDSFIKSVFTLGFSLFGDDGTRTVTEIQNLPAKIVDAFIQIDDDFASVPPAQAIRVKSFAPITVEGKVVSPMDYAHSSPIDLTMWQSYAALLGYTDGPVPPEQKMMTYYFQGQLLSEWDTIWNRNVAPELYKAFLKTVTLNVGGELTTLDKYYGGERYMTAYINGSATSQTRKDVAKSGINIKCNSPKIISLSSSPVTFVLVRMNLTYDTAHYHGTLWSGTIDADMLEVSSGGGAGGPVSAGVTKSAPERADEKRNPRNEDIFMGNRLLQHLNSNMEYYNRVLWSNLDANRRFMLLDGFQIETFDQYGMSEGFRSLASVLKNTLIAVVGNSLVLPVAPGYKVSQNLIVRRDSGVQAESLLDHFRPTIPQPPYRLSIPTRGVFAEAIMGSCNACEVVQPNSSQDWTKFTTDEPTAINAVAPALPAPASYNPQIKDLAAPIVNVQNAPTMPDPASGLAAVTALLGKGDTFRDVTGLSGTQQTALQTLLSDNENAKAFAQMASSMVTQGHNTTNSSAIMGTISGAKSDGTLSSKDASQLIKDHIQQQIDGGATKRAELAQQASQGKPSIPGAAVSAASSGKNVKASRTEASDGTVSESMEIADSTASASGSSGSAQAQVKDAITLVQQAPKSNGCWAAAATMMVSWLQKKSMSVEDVLKLAGGNYLDKWNNNETLSAAEKDDFLGSLGLVGEGPASSLPSQYIAWMNKYGPLWVTVDNGVGSAWSPHAKILTRINSDDVSDGTNTTMYFLDPAKSNATSSSFVDFEKDFEEVARDSPSSKLTLQVVHFGEPIPTGEGYEIEGPWNIKEPVHESITLTAMVQSALKLSPSTQLWKDQPTNELLRGIVWPDDPQCMMFDDDENDDANFGSGLLYIITFKWGNPNCLLKRSHFGDLQFLHAMGSTLGELPDDTVAKIKLWIETMYRTALGEFTASTTLASIPVVTNSNSATYKMNWVFERFMSAAKSMTLKQFLTTNTKYKSLDLKRRALGALLHTIEDSYAHGHTRRVLLNPSDVLAQTPTSITFKAGTYGKWGAVQNFHTYPNANHDAWDAYDKNRMDIGDPASFNALVGARDAIEKVTKIINFWAAGTKYDQGPRDLVENEIFAIATGAGGSDRTS